MTDDDRRRKRKKNEKVAARIKSADGSVEWASFARRTERQAARMKNVRPDIVLVERRLPPPAPARPTAAMVMARAQAARLAPRPRKPSRLDLWTNSTTAADRHAFRHRANLPLLDRLWLAAFDDSRLRERDERELRARAEARAEAESKAAGNRRSLPTPPARPSPAPFAPPPPLTDEAYAAEVRYDEAHPERRKRWVAEWLEDAPPHEPMMVITDQRRVTVGVRMGTFLVPRTLVQYTEGPAPGERRPEDRAADAYDVALRSGEVVRWWAGIQRGEEERKARWLSAMALKHPGADPSAYGILAIQDADREKNEREAAHYRDLAVERDRRAAQESMAIEKATRAKYGIPEGVPVLPPKPTPEPKTDAARVRTETHSPPTPHPPPGGVVSADLGIEDTGDYSPIDSPINSPPEPSRGEPARAVSPKASTRTEPSAGAGAVREAADGSEPAPTAPSLPERRAGRPRVHRFDPSEARWLKSLGFTTAEVVRELGLPDTASTRALVRAAVCE